MAEPYNPANPRTKQQGPGWLKAFTRRIVPAMLRNRQRTLLILVGIVLLYEFVERLIITRLGEPANQVFEVLHYIFLIPAVVWLVLMILNQYENERRQVVFDKDLQTDFSQQLGDAGSWDELTRRIVEWPHRVSLLTNATLFVVDPRTKCLKPECACDWQGLVTVKPALPPEPDTLPLPERMTGSSAGVPAQTSELHYNLPIFYSEQQIGMLKLEYPSGKLPEPVELRTLKNALPLIGLALEGALLQNLAAQQAEASQAERQHIAQHLHDTLAQNISYLRLKLDQLTGENAIREIGVVLQELERMRSTADEAYQQVRSTLDELNLSRGEDLLTTVERQGQAISDRAGFKLKVGQTGTPFPLPEDVNRQVLYVAREALHNVEKHAHAANVKMQFLWLEHELIVKFTDDGTGFCPPERKDGHYGLWIMQQRAQEIGGTVKVAQAGERGTEVTLWVPRPEHPAGPRAGIN